MKKLISLILFLATSLPVVASAATVEQLMGLGLPPALATELATESQFSFAGDAVIKVDADANRLFTFGATSDTALSLLFGDATDSQTLTIGSASANADDNDILALAGGSAVADGRGGSVELFGADVASTGGNVRITSDSGGAGGNILMAAWSGAAQNTNWTFVYDGRLSNDATNGGSIVFNKPGTFVQAAAYVPTPVSTPVLGTNLVQPGLNVIPTAAANTALWLGASTPVPGQQFMIYNNAGAAVRIKGAGAAVINGGTAGKYIEMGIGSYMECMTLTTAIQQCPFYTVNGVVAAMPTPA